MTEIQMGLRERWRILGPRRQRLPAIIAVVMDVPLESGNATIAVTRFRWVLRRIMPGIIIMMSPPLVHLLDFGSLGFSLLVFGVGVYSTALGFLTTPRFVSVGHGMINCNMWSGRLLSLDPKQATLFIGDVALSRWFVGDVLLQGPDIVIFIGNNLINYEAWLRHAREEGLVISHGNPSSKNLGLLALKSALHCR